MRSRLRAEPVLQGSAPDLGSSLSTNPIELFRQWLEHAVESNVPEPHTMTVSTVDASGMPDARVLTLKDLDARGWAFASTKSSTKGQQLTAQPYAALTFWWQPLVRSVRIRGYVVEASRKDSLADLQARSVEARQGVDATDWTLWRVIPSRVEFWQGSEDRNHTRIVFVAEDGRWRRDLG